MPDGARQARITIDGVEQAFYSEIDDEFDSGDVLLKTIPLGAFGHADGAGVHTVNGTSVVPDTGREFDFIACSRAHRTVNFGVRLAHTSREYRGRFKTAKEGSKLESGVMITWVFEGRVVR